MSIEDFRINAEVRRILARCWVDLEAVRFGAIGRTVYFHGRFQKVRPIRPPSGDAWEAGRPKDVSENLAMLEAVEKEVRRAPMVVDVVFALDNFRKSMGKWMVTGA